MNPSTVSRVTLGLLLIAVLVAGVILGSAVAAFGDRRATPSPTPSELPTPDASSELPAIDADGEDLDRLPRYPGAVRTEFEISVDDRYRLIAVEYLADAGLEDVRIFYQGVMDEQGWERADVNYAGGEWTYVLVDGRMEGLVELEESDGLVEIDLQVSEPVVTPTAQPASPAPSPADDDGDDGDQDDDADDDAGEGDGDGEAGDDGDDGDDDGGTDG